MLLNQECLLHAANHQWSASFTPAIPGLLWYGQNTRGLFGTQGGSPTDYTFNAPFEILSGFDQATVSGTTLSLPPSVYHSGILRFLDPVSFLTCSTTCAEPNDQSCTFGQLKLDLTQHPTPNGLVTVAAGDTRNYQAWHRDVASGAAPSNFSDGLSVTFR